MNLKSYWQRLTDDPAKTLLVLLAFSLPFDNTPSIDVMGLSLRLSAVIGGLIVLLVFKRLVYGQLSLKVPVAWMLAVAWLLWVSIGLFWVSDWSAAAKVVVPLFVLAGIGLASTLLWQKKYLEVVIKALLIGAIVAVGFGFFQFIGNYAGLPNSVTAIREEYSWQRFGFPRMQSTMLEPLYFSAYLLLPVGLLTTLLCTNKDYRKWYWFIALGLMLIADFLTLSRGGLLALFFLFIFLLAQFWHRGLLRNQLKTIIVSVAVIVFVGAAALGLINLVARQGSDSDLTYNHRGASTFLSHLQNFHIFANQKNKQNDDSIAQRQTARSQVIDILGQDQKVLWVGVGPGQYNAYKRDHGLTQNYGAPNNIILEQTLQSGLIGTVLLLAFGLSLIWALLKRSWKVRRQVVFDITLTKVCLAYILAIFVQAQTFTGLALTHLWFVIGLALFLVQLPPGKHKQNKIDARQKVAKN